MNSETMQQARDALGEEALRKLCARLDESLPTGTVEQRAPGRPAVRMSVQSFMQRTRAEMPRSHAAIRAQRKRERQNRKRGR